eukprot:1612943-Rhodomonas_salina.1
MEAYHGTRSAAGAAAAGRSFPGANQTTTPPPKELIDELLAGQCAGSSEILQTCFLDALPTHTGVYQLQSLGVSAPFIIYHPTHLISVTDIGNAASRSGLVGSWGARLQTR